MMNAQVDRLWIKESNIPIDVLFNDEINQIKETEFVENRMHNPIIFKTITNPDPKNDKNFVWFEIDGTS